MTRQEMEQQVGRLLLEQRRLARFDLGLPPDQRALLSRLLYRLGWTRGVAMSRRNPRRYSQRTYSHEDFVRKIAENPKDATNALVYADWLQENNMPTFAGIIRHHVARHDGSQGPHVMQNFVPQDASGHGANPVVHAELQGSHNLVYVTQDAPGYQHYFSQRTNSDAETNDLLDNLEKEGVVYVPGNSYPVTRRKKLSRTRFDRLRYADSEAQTSPETPTAKSAPPRTPERPKPLFAPEPSGSTSDRPAQDLRAFRQTVRPKFNVRHPKGVAPNSPEERVLLHAFLTQRGLKVEQGGEVPRYDPRSHTFYHPTPEDKGRVAQDYIAEAQGRVKLARDPRRYAKVPESEAGTLSPEQLQILARAHETGDRTGWGALGDHLAETGFPNAGAVLSLFGSGGEVHHSQNPVGRGAWPRSPGEFSYTTYRDDPDHPLLHHLFRVNDGAAVHTFRYGEPLEPSRHSRLGKYRYAKAERERDKAHPLVTGFPIEHALRHLANDARATTTLRDTAKHVLTTGEVSGLWGLHDLLQEHENADGTTGHPIAKAGYNFMSAADKIPLDRHVREGLHDEAERNRKKFGVAFDPKDVEPRIAEIANNLTWDFEHGRRDKEHSDRMRRISSRVYSLSGEKDPEKIKESIRRHAFRAAPLYRESAGIDTTQDRDNALGAVRPLSDRPGSSLTHKNEVATRYRRKVVVSGKYSYARFVLGRGEPLLGGSDFIHPISDESGNRVGHVWVSPQRGGTHLHVNHVGVSGHAPNATGLSGVRDIRDQLKAHYPNARTIGGTRISGAVRANTGGNRPTSRPLSRRKALVVKYAKPNRSDFLGALRRLQSSNHHALTSAATDVAGRMGITDTRVLPALHDAPGGSVPGVAQAVYGTTAPEKVHELAAWVNGLLPNSPGYAVFHPRPAGPDTLYRLRHDGSGMDLRARLDRAGIKSRVLIPHRKGFDVLIPDKGNKLQRNVAEYSQQNGLQVEASPGHFQTVGSSDQGQARETFRNKVVAGERVRQSRKGQVRRYAVDFPETIRQGVENSRRRQRGQGFVQDATAGKVLGDALDEAGEPHAPFFRNLVPAATSPTQRMRTERGTYRMVLPGYDHPISSRTTDGELAWYVRPARADSPDAPPAVFVHRDLEGGRAGGASHTAVLDAPALREWAAHPGVGPSLRAALVNAANHLESTGTRKLSRPARNPSASFPKRYSKVPDSEQGTLTPEQLNIARRAYETADHTGWGALGDHLQENGFPGAGALLSKVGVHTPGSFYVAGGGMAVGHEPGWFSYRATEVGWDVHHHLLLKTHEGEAPHVFRFRESPTPRPTRASRRQLCR